MDSKTLGTLAQFHVKDSYQCLKIGFPLDVLEKMGPGMEVSLNPSAVPNRVKMEGTHLFSMIYSTLSYQSFRSYQRCGMKGKRLERVSKMLTRTNAKKDGATEICFFHCFPSSQEVKPSQFCSVPGDTMCFSVFTFPACEYVELAEH